MFDEDLSGGVILGQKGPDLRQGGQLETSEQSWQETMRSEVGQWQWGQERTTQESVDGEVKYVHHSWKNNCESVIPSLSPKANRSFISASNWELCEVWYPLAAKRAYKRKHTICCDEFMPIGPTQIYTALILTLYLNKSLLLMKLRIPRVASCWPIWLDFFPQWWNVSFNKYG